MSKVRQHEASSFKPHDCSRCKCEVQMRQTLSESLLTFDAMLLAKALVLGYCRPGGKVNQARILQ